MNRGDICVKEFVSITGFLIGSGKAKIHKGFILAPRKIIDRLLSKNQYETIDVKLKYWKELHWIDADEKRYTKQVLIDGKRIRMIKIDVGVFQALSILFEEILGEK